MTRARDNLNTPCPYAKACGNCPKIGVDYGAQLRQKTERVARLLAPFAKVDPCVPSPQWECRNKIHFAFGKGARGATLGFFDARTKHVVDVDECRMHGAYFAPLKKALLALAHAGKNTVYDPRTHSGLLRYAVVRVLGSNALVTVVATRDRVDGLHTLYRALLQIFEHVSLYTDCNTSRSPAVLAGRFTHRFGEEGVDGSFCGVDFTLAPGSFLQVNDEVATRIYRAVCDEILAADPDTVVDAYCGIGITSVLFSRSARQVVGIELSPQAVRDARRLAVRNDAKNITFLCGDCKELLPTVRTQGRMVFFVDPPRAGLDRSVIASIKRFSPSHIVYLSCDPETLARDLRLLASDYRVTRATPYDMFPNTEHVETLVRLERKQN